jgi:hypothetical protein
MDNFDLTKFLVEGKLHEAMSPQDVVDIADTVAEEFTKESAEEGDFLIYTVGRMEGEGFELDTDVSAQTPDSIDTRGVGEGWGGIFRIKPTADGYEVRNAEKGGLVAMIDGSGNFRMLSAAESRDELDMDRYNDELDMKDDERNPGMYIDDEEWEREMGRMEENKYNPDLDQDDEEVPMPMDDEGRPLGENKNELKSNKMKKSELKEMIKSAFLEEANLNIKDETNMYDPVAEQEDVEVEDDENVDVNVEKDVEVDVDDESTETDTVVKTELPGENAEVTKTLGLLTKAQETAKALGDDKLTDQIGNTITYFTRAHVARQQTNEVKVNEVTFPMWSKINK